MMLLEKITFEKRGDDLIGVLSEKALEHTGDEFVVSFGCGCSLLLHPIDRWHQLEDRVHQLPLKQQIQLRPLLVRPARIKVGADRSWLLPGRLADFAHIQKEACLCMPDPSESSTLMQKSLILTAVDPEI